MANQYECENPGDDFVSVFSSKEYTDKDNISIEGVSYGDDFLVELSKPNAIKFANEILELASVKQIDLETIIYEYAEDNNILSGGANGTDVSKFAEYLTKKLRL